MTREEAKEILTHNWTRVDNPNYSESELDEAFFMAILPKGDLISRKVLMDRLESFCKWCKDGRLQGAEFVWDCIVPNVPSADAVEVVRCKDCKYSFYDKDYESYNCRKHEYVECFDADDYCSWGERND